MKALVILIDEKNKEEKLIKSKDIICPKCKESCKITMKEGKFKLYECINNHITENIRIKDFLNTQKINMTEIICKNCSDKNMGNSYQNRFYRCLTCKTNLCLLCKDKHNKENKDHTIILYEQKNYICPKHNGSFVEFCKKCLLNLCMICHEDHEDHDKIEFLKISPKKGEINNKLLEIKNTIDIIKKDNIKYNNSNQLNNLIEILEIYNQIFSETLNNYDIRNTNYNTILNVKELINNNELMQKLKEINQIKNLDNKIN